MGLDVALTGALSGVRVNQEIMGIIGQNVANASSVGYNRREITVSPAIVNGTLAGAEIESVRRAVDDFLQTSLQRQAPDAGRTAAVKDYFDRVELLLGQPGANNSLDTSLESFFNAMADLANNPEQASMRSLAVDRAVKLTQRVAGLAQGLEQMRYDIDHDIDGAADRVNELLGQIFTLNGTIKDAARLGGDRNALFDRRDQLVLEISGIIDVSVTYSEFGEVSLATPGNELLNPNQRFQLQYNPAISRDTMVNGDVLSAITVVQLDDNGNTVSGSSSTLLSASNAATAVHNFSSGKLQGLLDLRDTDLPRMLAQLDELAQTLADVFNAVHNDGSGYPAAAQLTGTKLVEAGEEHSFTGQLRIAMVNADGTPVDSSYAGENGLLPLTLNLDRLDGGGGQGSATIQDIINEINLHYGHPPAQKARLGDLDDIRLAAVSDSITSVKASGTIAYNGNPGAGDTITINGTVFTFVATGTPSSGTNIERQSSTSATVAEIARYLSTFASGPPSTATFSAVGTTLTVQHKTSGTAGNAFTVATNVTIGGTTASINGGAAGANVNGTLQNGANASGNFEFDFEFTNTSGGNAAFEVLAVTVNNGAAGFSGTLPGDFNSYTAAPGVRQRTGADGIVEDTITVSLTGSTQGEGGSHTVSVQIRVTDADGTVHTDTVSFTLTVPDPDDGIQNTRYLATGFTGGGDGQMIAPTDNSRFLTAELVDADGNAVADGEQGYLRLTVNQSGLGIVIDELNSFEAGNLSDTSQEATGRGLSHFFGLNDFFTTGGELKNSAYNLAVRAEFVTNPGRLSTTELVLSNQPSDPNADPVYTYEIGRGGNQVVNRLAALKQIQQAFDPAGTLPAITVNFAIYAGEIISYAATKVANARDGAEQEQLLFDAFKEKQSVVGGVNIDEELANTIIFQNNFTASARLVKVVDDLFKILLDTFK